jgi:hypothetical protein
MLERGVSRGVAQGDSGAKHKSAVVTPYPQGVRVYETVDYLR